MLERDVSGAARISPSEDQTHTCLIIDGMALIQMMKIGGSTTFGDMALVYYKVITAFHEQYRCNRINIVFGSYQEMSITAGESKKRSSSTAVEVNIYSSATPLPNNGPKQA